MGEFFAKLYSDCTDAKRFKLFLYFNSNGTLLFLSCIRANKQHDAFTFCKGKNPLNAKSFTFGNHTHTHTSYHTKLNERDGNFQKKVQGETTFNYKRFVDFFSLSLFTFDLLCSLFLLNCWMLGKLTHSTGALCTQAALPMMDCWWLNIISTLVLSFEPSLTVEMDNNMSGVAQQCYVLDFAMLFACFATAPPPTPAVLGKQPLKMITFWFAIHYINRVKYHGRQLFEFSFTRTIAVYCCLLRIYLCLYINYAIARYRFRFYGI